MKNLSSKKGHAQAKEAKGAKEARAGLTGSLSVGISRPQDTVLMEKTANSSTKEKMDKFEE